MATTTTTVMGLGDVMLTTTTGCEELGNAMVFNLTQANLVTNNLAGKGPNTGTAEEMRFSKVGATMDGTEFDLVVKVTGQDEYTPDNSTLNTAEGGHGFQIHFGVKAAPPKTHFETEFEFSFEDQQGNPVKLDSASFSLFDIDHDHNLKITESICYNVDSLDLKKTVIPGFDTSTLSEYAHTVLPGYSKPQLLTSYNKTHNCDGSSSTGQGSVRVESNQVGFGCDFNKYLETKDFVHVKCNSDQCQKHATYKPLDCNKAGHDFGYVNQNNETCNHETDADAGCDVEQGIHPMERYVTASYEGKSSFRVTLGLACRKPETKKCTRNFEFRGEYRNIQKCTTASG